MRLSLITLALALLGTVGCGGGEKPPESPTPKAIDETMHKHFERILELQQSVIAGELDVIKRRAGELGAGLRDADHPPGWKEHLQALRHSVFAAAQAQTLEQAAASTAKAAAACGDCHLELGISAREATGKSTSRTDSSVSTFMLKHLAAADSLWNGLVGPNDAAWTEGAEAMATVGALPESINITEEMRQQASKLKLLAKAAATSEGQQNRSRVYGELLSTCSGCHRLFLDSID